MAEEEANSAAAATDEGKEDETGESTARSQIKGWRQKAEHLHLQAKGPCANTTDLDQNAVDTFRAAVLEVLTGDGIGPEGLHMGAITERLGATVAEVKDVVGLIDVLGQMVDDGDIFSTFTQLHFAMV